MNNTFGQHIREYPVQVYWMCGRALRNTSFIFAFPRCRMKRQHALSSSGHSPAQKVFRTPHAQGSRLRPKQQLLRLKLPWQSRNCDQTLPKHPPQAGIATRPYPNILPRRELRPDLTQTSSPGGNCDQTLPKHPPQAGIATKVFFPISSPGHVLLGVWFGG